MLVVAILALVAGARGHGNMVWPPVWLDTEGWVGRSPGGQCHASGGTGTGNCMWFTNFTFTDGEVTLPQEMRTYQDPFPGFHYYDSNPWMAPGSAPIYSPCGVAGGNPLGCPVGDPTERECPGGGFSFGEAAESMEFPGVISTDWRRGGVEQVGWGIIANHGGGYSYRLCPAGEELTEECFQRIVLDFAGDLQWVEYGEGGEKVEFLANRTRTGTSPPASQWTRNPIPACIEMDGGYYNPTPACDKGTQFPPPAPGLEGYGENAQDPGNPTFLWTLMDLVSVPEDLTPGDYVLSFRWDCEQTSQIWSACSSINIL